MAYALAHLLATSTASFLYLQLLLALGIGWVWLGELPPALALVGSVLVLVGVMVVNARRRGTAAVYPVTSGPANKSMDSRQRWPFRRRG